MNQYFYDDIISAPYIQHVIIMLYYFSISNCKIIMLTCDLILLHVNKNSLVSTNKLHIDMMNLHVGKIDIGGEGGGGQKNATICSMHTWI